MLTSSTTTTTSTGGSAVWAPPSTAVKDKSFCGCLLSRSVKSCCCKPDTGFPDLSVTITSSVIRLLAGSDCCACPEKTKRQNTGIKRKHRVLMTNHLTPSLDPSGQARVSIYLCSAGVLPHGWPPWPDRLFLDTDWFVP